MTGPIDWKNAAGERCINDADVGIAVTEAASVDPAPAVVSDGDVVDSEGRGGQFA